MARVSIYDVEEVGKDETDLYDGTQEEPIVIGCAPISAFCRRSSSSSGGGSGNPYGGGYEEGGGGGGGGGGGDAYHGAVKAGAAAAGCRTGASPAAVTMMGVPTVHLREDGPRSSRATTAGGGGDGGGINHIGGGSTSSSLANNGGGGGSSSSHILVGAVPLPPPVPSSPEWSPSPMVAVAHAPPFSTASDVVRSFRFRARPQEAQRQPEQRQQQQQQQQQQRPGSSSRQSYVQLHERLVESPFALQVPLQLVQLRCRQLEQAVDRLHQQQQQYEQQHGSSSSSSSGGLESFEVQRRRALSMLYSYQGAWKAMASANRGLPLAAYDAPHSAGLFRSSKDKGSAPLRFVPTNCHLHLTHLTTTGGCSTSRGGGGSSDSSGGSGGGRSMRLGIVSVGAFAAHPLGFKKGGLSRLQASYLAAAAKLEGLRTSAGGAGGGGGGGGGGGATAVTGGADFAEQTASLAALGSEIAERRDVCLSQALVALLTAFVSSALHTVGDSSNSPISPTTAGASSSSASSSASSSSSPVFDGDGFWPRVAAAGFLCTFESLLSTRGSDLGMLEDMEGAVSRLGRVRLRIAPPAAMPPPSAGAARALPQWRGGVGARLHLVEGLAASYGGAGVDYVVDVCLRGGARSG